jgi:hypothetical protein
MVLLKKGTGSELMAYHATEKRLRRGACTLFQQAPKPAALLLTAGIVIPFSPQPRTASAFERYNDGCHTCHGWFLDGTSPAGTVFPADSKHAMHANIMATQCALCHRTGDNWNPYTGWSDGTAHNPPAGCTGCHGRDYGPDIGNSGVGLRAHHALAGVSVCAMCHTEDPTPLPETVAPSYYGTPDTVADDSCNKPPAYLENWSIGDTLGLDNDGDGIYDTDDDDCHSGDVNLDGQVSLDDYIVFAAHMAGPGEPLGAGSEACDVDGDTDADLGDFSVLQRTLTE